MIKKIPLWFCLFLFLFLPVQAGATSVTTVYHSSYYDSSSDTYKVTYSGWPSNVTWFQLYFTDHSGTYERKFMQKPTGYQTLTCNGTYQIQFFNSSNQMVGKTGNILTSNIKTQTCVSAPEPEPPPTAEEPPPPTTEEPPTPPIPPYNPSPVQIPYQTLFTPAFLDEMWGYFKWVMFFIAPLLMIWIALEVVKLFVVTMKNRITDEGRRGRYDDD